MVITMPSTRSAFRARRHLDSLRPRGVLCTVSFLSLVLFSHGFGQSLLVDTTFQDSSATGWNFPDTGNGQAKLTSGVGDPAGQGWLELTPNPVAHNRTGFAYLNTVVPLGSGVDIKLQYQTWGRAVTQGADGFALDLFHNTTGNPPTAGGYGGSLGYAQELNGVNLVPGLTGGILGVGIDEKGNFAAPSMNRVGGPGNRVGVTLRGPGSGSGSTVGTAPNYGFLGTATVNPAFSIQTGPVGATTRPTGAANLRFAEFRIDTTELADGLLPVTITLTNGSGSTPQVIQFDIYSQLVAFYGTAGAIPTTFQIGFTSSTGAQDNVHDIRNVTVTSLLSVPGTSDVDAGAPIVDFVATGPGATETGSNWSFGAAPVSGDDVFVSNGGTAMLSSAATVMRLDLAALSNSATGTFTVQGGTGSLTVTTDVTVGEDGTGTLNVGSTGSGIVADTNGIIGEFAGSNGTATVSGTGSTWSNSGDLNIGQTGTGTLNIQTGGTVSAGGVVTIARDAGSVGTLNLLTGGILQVGGTNGLASGAGTANFNFGGGTIQVTGSNLTSSINAVLSTPSSTIDTNGLNAAFSGVLTGSGGLTKSGAGTLALTGANTYTGGTNFNGGIVAVNSDTNLGTGPLTFNGGTLQSLTPGGGLTLSQAVIIGSGGRFLGDPDTMSALSGAISGPGLLTKDGPGTVVLSGKNTYSGGTAIDLGTLIVANAQALGTGNVAVIGGVLAADRQPINVAGNYTQFAGGTLQLKVAGADPGQYDSLNIGGNAALGGTLQLISLGFQPQAGNRLTLVSTDGLVSGRFAQFENPFATGPGFSLVELLYEPHSVLLEFLNYTAFAQTPNQGAAASLLDTVHLDPRAANLISFMNSQPLAKLPGDFQKISPDDLTSFYEISFSNANIQRLNLEGRIDDIRNGSNGFNSNMKVNGAAVNTDERTGGDGKSSKSVVEPIFKPAPENRWGVWTTGFGDFVSVNGDANANGYNFTTGGVSLGIDYRLTDEWVIGVMGEYSHTWTSLKPSGSNDVNSGRGGLYATWFNHGFYLDAAIYGGYNSYNSSRSALQGLASGHTEGAELSTFISGGYDFHFGLLSVGPIAALQYTYAHIDGFTENGSLAPMQIQSGSASSLRSDFGFRLFYPWQVGKVIIEPSLKAAWEHEYMYSAFPVTAGFAGISGPTATFTGPTEGHDSAIVSAGVSVLWTPTLTTYLNYDGQLGRNNYDSNAVIGGARISF